MSKFLGREGGQHDQHFVKNKFVKNRVGGREVNLNLDNVFKYTVFFGEYPLIRLFIIVFFIYIFEGSGICGITVSCGVREGVL